MTQSQYARIEEKLKRANATNTPAQAVVNLFQSIPQFAGSNLAGKTVARSRLLKPF